MKEIIKLKMTDKSVDFLKEMAIKLSTDFREGAADVFHACLDTLEQKMSETDFVKFCDENL